MIPALNGHVNDNWAPPSRREARVPPGTPSGLVIRRSGEIYTLSRIRFDPVNTLKATLPTFAL
jgi:hypothetical protein